PTSCAWRPAVPRSRLPTPGSGEHAGPPGRSVLRRPAGRTRRRPYRPHGGAGGAVVDVGGAVYVRPACPPRLGSRSRLWHDFRRAQPTRRRSSVTRPRPAAAGPGPDGPRVRATPRRRRARPGRQYVGRPPQPPIPPRVRRIALRLPDDP